MIKTHKIKANVEAKNDKNQKVKINNIKRYFESMNTKPMSNSSSNAVCTEENGQGDIEDKDKLTKDTKKVIVKDRIDAFELLMRSSGGTLEKTPKKRLKRIGNGSSVKKR